MSVSWATLKCISGLRAMVEPNWAEAVEPMLSTELVRLKVPVWSLRLGPPKVMAPAENVPPLSVKGAVI